MWHFCLTFFLIVMVGGVVLLSGIQFDCEGWGGGVRGEGLSFFAVFYFCFLPSWSLGGL